MKSREITSTYSKGNRLRLRAANLRKNAQTFWRFTRRSLGFDVLNVDEAKRWAHLHCLPRSFGYLYKTIAPNTKDKNFSRSPYAQLGTSNRTRCKSQCCTQRNSKRHHFAFPSFLTKYVNI
jgi:hypothetical protein